MKLSRITILCLALFAMFMYSCKPDNVKPRGADDMGAFSGATGITNQTGGEHEAPVPGCSEDRIGQLAIDYLGTAYQLPGTEYILANNDEHLYVQIKAMPGWGFSEVALEALTSGEIPPQDANGKTLPSSFESYDLLAANTNWYMWKIPMNELELVMSYACCAKLVNNTNPAQNFTVWLNGQSISGAGGFTLDYQLGVQNCPGACEVWLNASNPCPPPCGVPTLGPGSDLSEFHCQKGNNPNVKVTICHMPPGNPANMQSICVKESALPAHVVDFKPANNACMGHHSGCHLGPCDPCGAGSSQSSIDAAVAFMAANACPGK